jgi:hypothetical protein
MYVVTDKIFLFIGIIESFVPETTDPMPVRELVFQFNQ